MRINNIIKLLKGFAKRFAKKPSSSGKKRDPLIIPRAEHGISRSAIHHNALKVLYRLHNAGYQAYLVGGCVRDLLMGRQPKDFDVATDAHPDEVRKLFKNCRLIGKRFRLAHILFGRDIIEVATFRTYDETASREEHHRSVSGMIMRDNVYGTMEDDVLRRDFTVNALYYNIADFSIVDYLNGVQDVESRTLRIIGDPEKRFQEDPVRLLRAIRFMGKLGLTIAEETEASLMTCHHFLQHVSSARLYQEVLKLFQEGATFQTFQLLEKYQLLASLFPHAMQHGQEPKTRAFFEEALRSADERIRNSKTVSPAFLFSVLLWPAISKMATQVDMPPMPALEKAIHDVVKQQIEHLAIPRHLTMTVREICTLQHRFTQRHGSRPYRLLSHPRFRAAYDLLLLRNHKGEVTDELANWWIAFETGTTEQRDTLLQEANKASHQKGRRQRR